MANDLITIEGTALAVREYNGQRVVTFKDIDTVHQRPSGTARNTFNRNKSRFEVGKHYFMLQLETENSNVRLTDIRNIVVPSRGITVLTERGYLMLVKAFTDDLSWKVQDELISGYFKAKELATAVSTALIDDGLKYNTSGTPLPKTKSWYDRNVEKINWICSRLGWQQSTVIHKLLVRIGAEYDLNEADRIYQQETGREKRYMLDLVDYFPELADMATNWIDEMLNWIK
jgi:hypothetical protein